MSDEAQRKAKLIDFLKFKTYAGFTERGYPLTKEYTDRIEYELGVIDQCGFAEYFLIVADLCRFMREKKIRHMPRGSGAGSAVVWGLGITHRWIDPVALGIPFERFLNPQRVSNPDIDIDIRDDRRWEVVQYTIDKYGADKVARIITFSFLSAKSAIKDVVRAMNLPDYQALGESMANLIPAGKGEDGKNHRIDDVLKTNEALRDYERLYPDVFKMVRKCEGKARHPSIHAAGTIIAPDEMTNYTPLFFAKSAENREQADWFPTTQWDMYDCEDRGLLKMDYLGLKTLRVIDETVEAINVIRAALGQPADFDIDYVKQDDLPTWKMLADGQLAGVFQVERNFVRTFAKMMGLDKKMTPWDLAVLVAIIRPGMMDSGNTTVYLKRAQGLEDPTPPHPLLTDTFKKTFGIMCFQEDVMSTCVDFSGFTKAEADVVRKGVGKKNPAFIAKQQPMFFEGGMQPRVKVSIGGKEYVTKPRNPELVAALQEHGKRLVVNGDVVTVEQIEGSPQARSPVTVDVLMKGATREECEHVWTLIEAHSRYSFNNAHAAVYGMVGTYQTAYLKANWSLPYMMNLVNSEAGVTDKIAGYNWKVAEYIDESRSLGLKVHPPCVQRSKAKCSMSWHDQGLRFGLTLVKRVSNGAVDWICSAESGCQQSTTLKEFIIRCFACAEQQTDAGREWRVYSKVGKGDLEALCSAGAFDCFDKDRGRVKASIVPLQELAKKYHEQCCKVRNGKKTKLSPAQVMEAISNFTPKDDEVPDLTLEQMLDDEREVTGCFLSQTPFEPFRWQIKRNQTCSPADLQNDEFDYNGEYLVFAGLVADVREITIKNGKNKGKLMGILKLVGTAGSIEVPAFTDTWLGLKTEQEPTGPERGKVYLVQVNPDNRSMGKYILQQMTRLSNTGVAT